MKITSVNVTQVFLSSSPPTLTPWEQEGKLGAVTIGRTVEEFNVEEGVVSAGHAASVRRQHDAPDGVATGTHDHHWGEE
jgi:hypothetical protein